MIKNLNITYKFISLIVIVFAMIAILGSDSRQGLGGLDIYFINLNKTEDAQNLGKPVNSEKDDFAFTINEWLRSWK